MPGALNIFGGGSSGGGASVPQLRQQVIDVPGYRLSVNPQTGRSYINRGRFDPATEQQVLSVPQMELARRFPEMLTDLDTLKGQVAPTSSLFRTAAMNQIANAESSAVGNLREQLARRGLSGASFGNDTEARVRAQFGQERVNAELATAQQEIALSTQLIDFQNNLINQQLQREMAELGLASGLAVSFNQISSQNAAVQAQISAAQAMANAQGQGQLLGTLGGLLAFGGGQSSAFTGNNLFGGSGPLFGSSGFFGSSGSLAGLFSSGGGGGDPSGAGFGTAAPF